MLFRVVDRWNLEEIKQAGGGIFAHIFLEHPAHRGKFGVNPGIFENRWKYKKSRHFWRLSTRGDAGN